MTGTLERQRDVWSVSQVAKTQGFGDGNIAIIDSYSKEELESIIKSSYSYKEVLEKLGYYSHSGSSYKMLQDRIQKYNIDISHFVKKKKIVRNEENIFIKDSTVSQHCLRDWYLKGKYTEYKCSICGQEPFWQGKSLTLILDHINGKNHDNRLENLRWVCPNCNQQLDTTGYRKFRTEQKSKKEYFCSNCGKKISKGSTLCVECLGKTNRTCERPNRQELKNMIRTMSFVDIGKKYNVSDNAIRKWCDTYNLPRLATLIKQIPDDEWEKI